MKYIATSVVDNEELIKGNLCITDLQELYTALVAKDTDTIVLRKSFTDKFFTPSGLVDFLQNAALVAEGVDIIPEDTTNGYREDAVQKLQRLDNEEEFLNALLFEPQEVIDTVQHLCASYMNAYSETLLANSKLSTLHMQYINLTQKYAELQDKYEKLQKLKEDYASSLDVLVSRINYKYNKPLDVNKQMQIPMEFCHYNKILYIKEVTRVKFVDTFVYYLMELLKTLYDVPARLVVIEPFYSHQRAYLYPMCKPNYDLTYNDVRESDIFMAGLQPRLMEAILANPSHINYLIILDRGGYHNVHVLGEKIDYIYTVSDVKDLKLDVPLDHVITYDTNTLYIPFIDGFDKLAIEEKIREYSSMESMKHVIELIERR